MERSIALQRRRFRHIRISRLIPAKACDVIVIAMIVKLMRYVMVVHDEESNHGVEWLPIESLSMQV